ncbi:MAG: transposase [Treponema sp.]|nr:transposase [Treponema sp.]
MCEWKHIEILVMTIIPDCVHLAAIISPKLSIAEAMEILKGTAIAVFQQTKRLRTKS